MKGPLKQFRMLSTVAAFIAPRTVHGHSDSPLRVARFLEETKAVWENGEKPNKLMLVSLFLLFYWALLSRFCQ